MLRTRSFLFFLGVTVCLVGLSLSASWFIVVDAMDKEERRLVQGKLQGVRAALESQMNQLARTAADWAFWDATYQFIETLDKTYINENITPEAFKTLRLKGMLFYDERRAL